MESYLALSAVVIIVVLRIKKHKELKGVSGPLVTEVQEESTLWLVSIRVSFPSEYLKRCTLQPVYLVHHFMQVSKTEENRS